MVDKSGVINDGVIDDGAGEAETEADETGDGVALPESCAPASGW